MANNEKVSQLLNLFASDIQSDDVFLVTDTSQRESKKLEIGELISFIENSGSFDAYHAIIADTSSYILSTNISGIIPLSTNSTQSISSSFSTLAYSSSHAIHADTSSYSDWCVITATDANTASYLTYSGVPNGTASYSIKSQLSDDATQAFNLYYDGNPNGTSSYAISSSMAISSSYAISSSLSQTASYSVTSSHSNESNHTINSDTASYCDVALTASYVSNVVYGPKFITPIVIKSTTQSSSWAIYQCPTEFIPIGTNTVILDGWSKNSGTNASGFIEVSPNSASISSAYYVLLGYESSGGGDGCTYGGQGTFPCSSSASNSSSFYYTFTLAANGGTTLRLIGYY